MRLIRLKRLNDKSSWQLWTFLVSSFQKKNEAIRSKDENVRVLEAIHLNKLDCNLSIKLTMLGLQIDYNFCLDMVKEILEKAKSINCFVRIDMEDSSVTDLTIKIFEDSKKIF